MIKKKLDQDEESSVKQDIIDKLLKDVPVEEETILDFPSLGKFYNTDGKPVTLKPMSWEDEKILVSTGGGPAAVESLLNRCLQGISSAELIPMDKVYVLLKLREISYGAEYEVIITCPAPMCKHKGEVSININELRIVKVPEDFEDPREVTLPKSGLKVKVRFQKASEEQFFSEPGLFYGNLWRLVTQIGGYTDREIIAGTLKQLPLIDLHTLKDAIFVEQYGVDTRFMYGCPKCKTETLMEVPLGSDFFSVNSRKS
jgi:hypothetical protein